MQNVNQSCIALNTLLRYTFSNSINLQYRLRHLCIFAYHKQCCALIVALPTALLNSILASISINTLYKIKAFVH